jgi:oligopeptide/dipeptide ABC transporter ATP-binding protein
VPPLLEVRGLTVDYAAPGALPVRALAGVDLTVAEGEAVAVVGESGSGKSTLALALLGLLPRSARLQGSIRYRGQELCGQPEAAWRALRGAQASLVFQDPALTLTPVRRVGPQVAEVVRTHRDGRARAGRAEAEAALAEVGLPATAYGRYPHQLSGGQRQRVAVARALACSPSLLVADEPTSMLDSVAAAELRALLVAVQRKRGLALLLVTHDLAALPAVAQRALVLYAGRMVEAGEVGRVLGRPLHPYTRGLIRALPRARQAGQPRIAPVPIAGAAPDLSQAIAGCTFAPRCPDRIDVCVVADPGEREVEGGRVRCVLHG